MVADLYRVSCIPYPISIQGTACVTSVINKLVSESRNDVACRESPQQQWTGLHLRKAPDQSLVLLRIERLGARGTRQDSS